MQFEWDQDKATANQRKHAVSFDEAASIFRSFCLFRIDNRRDYGEPRLIALGIDTNGVLLQVIYTLRGETIRIISAWKAAQHERKAYQEAANRPL